MLFWTGFNEFRAKLNEVRANSRRHSSTHEDAIGQVPLVEYFPEYSGGTDADEGARCILLRFLEVNRARLRVYSQ